MPSSSARLAQRHPAYAELKALGGDAGGAVRAPASAASPRAPNAAGAYLAGAVPHREPGGAPAAMVGLVGARHARSRRCKAYVLFGGIDPARRLRRRARARWRPPNWSSPSPRILPEACAACAHVVLPIGSFAETSGTFVNAEGRWQSWAGAAKLPGESRPGWKVLRVLANLLNLRGVDYDELR